MLFRSAFEATYVTTFDNRPTLPIVINMVESKISNNLIVSRPHEIERAIRDNNGRTKKEELDAEIEAEAARRLAQRLKDSADEIEKAADELQHALQMQVLKDLKNKIFDLDKKLTPVYQVYQFVHGDIFTDCGRGDFELADENDRRILWEVEE